MQYMGIGNDGTLVGTNQIEYSQKRPPKNFDNVGDQCSRTDISHIEKDSSSRI